MIQQKLSSRCWWGWWLIYFTQGIWWRALFFVFFFSFLFKLTRGREREFCFSVCRISIFSKWLTCGQYAVYVDYGALLHGGWESFQKGQFPFPSLDDDFWCKYTEESPIYISFIFSAYSCGESNRVVARWRNSGRGNNKSSRKMEWLTTSRGCLTFNYTNPPGWYQTESYRAGSDFLFN